MFPEISKLVPVGLLLQAEQQARLEAQLELNRQKKKVAGLEAEVQQQRTAMHQVGHHHCNCCSWADPHFQASVAAVTPEGHHTRHSIH
jgi:hypothetical protein